MRTVQSDIVIDAPAERVWRELLDTGSYPQWNPFIRELDGNLALGERLVVRLRLFGKRPMTFKPVVTVLTPERELRWQARLLLPKLFDVDRYILLEPASTGSVRFIQGETCTGPLTPLMFSLNLERRLLRGYRAMNRALKARCESAGPAHETTPAPR